MRWSYFLIATVFAASMLAQPKPSPHLGDLKSFAGTWRCSGKAFATPWGPEHPTTATIHVAWVLGRFWLKAEYVEQKTARNPNPAAGHVYWGYDEQKKKLTGHAVNNFGGHVTVESDGWKDARIVWNGMMSAGGATTPTRDTFVRKGVRKVVHKTEAEMNGQWLELDEETCTKTP